MSPASPPQASVRDCRSSGAVDGVGEGAGVSVVCRGRLNAEAGPPSVAVVVAGEGEGAIDAGDEEEDRRRWGLEKSWCRALFMYVTNILSQSISNLYNIAATASR
jgi:hypothetical protein